MFIVNIKPLPIHFHYKSHWYEYHGIRLSPFLPETSPSFLRFLISGATWHYMPCASYISSITWSSSFFHHGTFSWYSPTLSYCLNLPSAYHISTQNNMLLQSKVHIPRPTSKPLPHLAQFNLPLQTQEYCRQVVICSAAHICSTVGHLSSVPSSLTHQTPCRSHLSCDKF